MKTLITRFSTRNIWTLTLAAALFASGPFTQLSAQSVTQKVAKKTTKAAAKPKPDAFKQAIDATIAKFAAQYAAGMVANTDTSRVPRTFQDGKVKTVNTGDWTSGFYAGTLWYLYEATNDKKFFEEAKNRQRILEKEQYNKGTHDLGFMIFCPFGAAMRLDPANADHYGQVIKAASQSLASRFNPQIGLIRSWDHGKWKYPVIIDNMMNLEMLMWAAREYNMPEIRQLAITHAFTTKRKHFRPDNSSFHVVDFNPQDGSVLKQGTHQGYADESSWARGQAWGLYGYTTMYRWTKDTSFLGQAVRIANYIINHPNLPADKVPYWDYDDPAAPNAPRDASAAAITASALYELQGYVDKAKRKTYTDFAHAIVKSLSTDAYMAKQGENGHFMLMHSVGSKPHNSEVDVPLNYADYYFIEALLRAKGLKD